MQLTWHNDFNTKKARLRRSGILVFLIGDGIATRKRCSNASKPFACLEKLEEVCVLTRIQDWETFCLMFEEFRSGFLMRLKEEYSELRNADLKLCTLLRLNMNLKESSRILEISSDSVQTARSRLRKKLGLKTEEILVNFLIRFENRYNTLYVIHCTTLQLKYGKSIS